MSVTDFVVTMFGVAALLMVHYVWIWQLLKRIESKLDELMKEKGKE